MLLSGYKVSSVKANCFISNLIVPVAICHQREFEAYFISGICDYLCLSKSNKCLYQNRIYHMDSRDKKTYEQLVGFYWVKIFSKTLDYRQLIINELLQNKPVGVCINTNFVPWAKYRGIDNHHFLIIGIENDELICIDNYYSDSLQKFPLEKLLKSKCYFLTCEFNDDFSIEFDKAFCNVLSNVRKKAKNVRLSSIERFKEYFIETPIDRIVPTESFDINKSVMIIDINHFAQERLYLANVLQQHFTDNKCFLFKALYEHINKEVILLEHYKMYMIKLFLLKKTGVYCKCCDILCEIVTLERKITEIVYEI